jgi:hypothetical protein
MLTRSLQTGEGARGVGWGDPKGVGRRASRRSRGEGGIHSFHNNSRGEFLFIGRQAFRSLNSKIRTGALQFVVETRRGGGERDS